MSQQLFRQIKNEQNVSSVSRLHLETTIKPKRLDSGRIDQGGNVETAHLQGTSEIDRVATLSSGVDLRVPINEQPEHESREDKQLQQEVLPPTEQQPNEGDMTLVKEIGQLTFCNIK